MVNVSREMETLQKYQKKILEIKNIVTEINDFDVLISRLDVSKESVSLRLSQQKFPKLNEELVGGGGRTR